MKNSIDPQDLKPLKLQVFWALSQLENEVCDSFSIREIVSYLVDELEVATSRQAVLNALKSDKKATHKIGSSYKLMQDGKKQLSTKGIVDVNIKKFGGKNAISFENLEVLKFLKKLDLDLGGRYSQAIRDLSDPARISYAGTANELRETVRITLLLKAPDDEVKQMDWFKNARESDKKNALPKLPTRAERVRFILEKRKKSGKAVETTQGAGLHIDDKLGRVVSSTCDRMSVGVHNKEDRDEIIQCLKYINAFLSDILS